MNCRSLIAFLVTVSAASLCFSADTHLTRNSAGLVSSPAMDELLSRKSEDRESAAGLINRARKGITEKNFMESGFASAAIYRADYDPRTAPYISYLMGLSTLNCESVLQNCGPEQGANIQFVKALSEAETVPGFDALMNVKEFQAEIQTLREKIFGQSTRGGLVVSRKMDERLATGQVPNMNYGPNETLKRALDLVSQGQFKVAAQEMDGRRGSPSNSYNDGYYTRYLKGVAMKNLSYGRAAIDLFRSAIELEHTAGHGGQSEMPMFDYLSFNARLAAETTELEKLQPFSTVPAVSTAPVRFFAPSRENTVLLKAGIPCSKKTFPFCKDLLEDAEIPLKTEQLKALLARRLPSHEVGVPLVAYGKGWKKDAPITAYFLKAIPAVEEGQKASFQLWGRTGKNKKQPLFFSTKKNEVPMKDFTEASALKRAKAKLPPGLKDLSFVTPKTGTSESADFYLYSAAENQYVIVVSADVPASNDRIGKWKEVLFFDGRSLVSLDSSEDYPRDACTYYADTLSVEGLADLDGDDDLDILVMHPYGLKVFNRKGRVFEEQLLTLMKQ